MKLFWIAVASGICVSCFYLEDSCSLGLCRDEALYGYREMPGDQMLSGFDTVFFVCAVDMQKGYDWVEDVSVGLGPGNVLLFRNNDLVLKQEIGYENGLSSEADTHHMIDGHLLTEFSRADRTVIKKDGVVLLEYEGRECLCGLCEYDGIVHTLGTDRGSGALIYRKDGEVIFSLDNAYAFGSFQDFSYPETGALYVSEGRIYFCYVKKTGSTVFYHLVENGMDNAVEIGQDHIYYGVQDMKMLDGELYVVSGLSSMSGFRFGTASSARGCGGDYSWTDLKIVRGDGETAAFGRYSEFGTLLGSAIVNMEGKVKRRGPGDAVAIGTRLFDVSHPDCFVFSRTSFCLVGNVLAEILTPRNLNEKPFLKKGRDTLRYNVNGYLTAVSAEVSRTRSMSLSRPQRR